MIVSLRPDQWSYYSGYIDSAMQLVEGKWSPKDDDTENRYAFYSNLKIIHVSPASRIILKFFITLLLWL